MMCVLLNIYTDGNKQTHTYTRSLSIPYYKDGVRGSTKGNIMRARLQRGVYG